MPPKRFGGFSRLLKPLAPLSQADLPRHSTWQRHFFYRAEVVRLTWKIRLALLVLIALSLLITRRFWSTALSGSLTCTGQPRPSELILVENFEPEYLLFERAAALREEGFAARVLVPIQISQASRAANTASVETAKLLAQLAHLRTPEFLPIRAAEPINLNTAYELRDFLAKEHLKSVVVVTSGFRSKRASLVYEAVLARSGVAVSCVPVFVGAGPHNWSQSWHGIEEVTQQFFKLQFYRFYVLMKPRRSTRRAECAQEDCES